MIRLPNALARPQVCRLVPLIDNDLPEKEAQWSEKVDVLAAKLPEITMIKGKKAA